MKKTIDYLFVSIVPLLALLFNLWMQRYVTIFYGRYYMFSLLFRLLPIAILFFTAIGVTIVVMRSLVYAEESSYHRLLLINFGVYFFLSFALIFRIAVLVRSVVIMNGIYYFPLLAGLYLGLWIYLKVTQQNKRPL